jgi:hypothetical protein
MRQGDASDASGAFPSVVTWRRACLKKAAAPMIENRLLRTAALKAAHPTAS